MAERYIDMMLEIAREENSGEKTGDLVHSPETKGRSG